FHDQVIGTLVVPGLLAQRRESPRRLRMVALDAAFTTTVRMVHRVHGHATNRGTNTAPARASSLAKSFVLMVEVANLANRSHALQRKLAYFAAGQLDERDVAFFREQLR